MEKCDIDNNIVLSKTVERNGFIDVIKGICILFVIFTHYTWTTMQWHRMLFPFWIDMAVPMFMIISGYVGALSFERKGANLDNAYSFQSIFSKCLRFIVPFSFAYLIEFFAEMFYFKNHGFSSLIVSYFTGGFGPGSFYFPIMIQFVFLFPVIYFVIKKYETKGLLIFFVTNMVYEILKSFYGMNETLYRLLLLRYLFLISFGCFVYLNRERKIKIIWGVISLFIGIAFLILVEYTSYKPMILIYWTRTSFLGCLYLLPIAYFLLRLQVKRIIKPLALLGKASFNIFLTQMVYYYYAASFIYGHIDNIILRNTINILICCILGLVFYFIESPITKKIIQKINKSDCLNTEKINNFFMKKTI